MSVWSVIEYVTAYTGMKACDETQMSAKTPAMRSARFARANVYVPMVFSPGI
jgi:hypothetical protein